MGGSAIATAAWLPAGEVLLHVCASRLARCCAAGSAPFSWLSVRLCRALPSGALEHMYGQLDMLQ